MDFYNRIKSFLGLPNQNQDENTQNRFQQPPILRETPQPPSVEDDFRHHFDMFSDTFQIHKYFEQQMSEMLRNFGFMEFPDEFNLPQLEDTPKSHSGELRDQFLKPQYEYAKPGIKSDQDMDGKLDMRDLDSILDGRSNPQPRSFFSGKSMSTRTVINGDTVEIHKTVRDSEGNEETTITRKKGDQEHTVIKRKDKDGKEEIIENMVNLDEENGSSSKLLPLPENYSLFDKFFK